MVTFIEDLNPYILSIALVFLRVAAAIYFAPVFGEVVLSLRIKLLVALSVTLLIHPSVEVSTEKSIFSIAASELAIGIFLGLSLKLLVLVIQVTGMIIAQVTSLSHLVGGVGVDPQSIIAQVIQISALALIVILDIHIKIILWLSSSYHHIAIGGLPTADAVVSLIVGSISEMFELSFLLSTPFIAISLIYNLSLGFINRAMPQLMVAFVGAPLITGVTLVLLSIIASTILIRWAEFLSQALKSSGGLL